MSDLRSDPSGCHREENLVTDGSHINGHYLALRNDFAGGFYIHVNVQISCKLISCPEGKHPHDRFLVEKMLCGGTERTVSTSHDDPLRFPRNLTADKFR